MSSHLRGPAKYLDLRDEVSSGPAARHRETWVQAGAARSPEHRSGRAPCRVLGVTTPEPTFRAAPTEKKGPSLVPPDAPPITVTGHVAARLHLSETCQVSFPTLLRYDPKDPYAVTATLHVGADRQVDWVFGRDLLAAGLHRQSGAGDVVLGPVEGASSTEVELVLSVRDEHARLTLPAESLAAFLQASHHVVPPGTEGDHLELDATILRLLSN